jgi:lysophospholipase L1-like esterase
MGSKRPPFVLKVRREIVYAAIVVGFLFATAEVVVRVQKAVRDARRGARPYSVRSVTHDGVAYAHEEGQIALVLDPHLVYRTAPGQRTERVTINRDGFRGAEWRHDKPPGTRRVAVLGGSAAFGTGASGDEQVFTVPLEAELDRRARLHGSRAEVWNAGAVGYDSTQELVLLATRLVDLAPDVVVLFDGWNDFNQSAIMPEGYVDLLHPKFFEIDALLARKDQVGFELLRCSSLFRSLESGARRWARRLAPKGEFGEFRDRSDTAVPRYERNLRAMIRLARAYGAAPIVAAQPELFDRADPTEAEQALQRSREDDGYAAWSRASWLRFVAAARVVAQYESAPFIDCARVFDGVAETAFTDCVHLSDRGHAILAAHLAPVVAAALGW